MPPPFAEAGRFFVRQPHPQLDAIVEIDDFERGDFLTRLHDSFAEAEADREVVEVLRRAHHDGIGAAVIGERQRGLFRNRTRSLAEARISPYQTVDGANRIAHGYSAASSGAIRREWRACSS